MRKAVGILGVMLVGVLALGIQGAGQGLVISELAWAGTAASSYDEWIELRNASDVSVSLAGWVLRIGETIVPLGEATEATVEARTAMVDPGAYLVLERTDDNAVSDVVADVIYTGSLSNTGVLVELVDPSGEVVDRIDTGDAGWPGGGSGSGEPPYCTMERTPSMHWDSNDGITVNGLDADGNPLNGTPGQVNSTDIRAQHEPQVAIEYPAQADLVVSGTLVVRWEATDPDGDASALQVTLSASVDNGSDWAVIAENLANTGSFAWDTSSFDACERCILRIEATDPDGITGRAISAPFTIE